MNSRKSKDMGVAFNFVEVRGGEGGLGQLDACVCLGPHRSLYGTPRTLGNNNVGSKDPAVAPGRTYVQAVL